MSMNTKNTKSTKSPETLTGSQWKKVDNPPDEDGWYLGSFDGALRCIGFDNGKFDFWGTPCDHLPEDLTHWTELPSIENVEGRHGVEREARNGIDLSRLVQSDSLENVRVSDFKDGSNHQEDQSNRNSNNNTTGCFSPEIIGAIAAFLIIYFFIWR